MSLSGNCTEAREQENMINPDQLLHSLFCADTLDVLTYCLIGLGQTSLFTSCIPPTGITNSDQSANKCKRLCFGFGFATSLPSDLPFNGTKCYCLFFFVLAPSSNSLGREPTAIVELIRWHRCWEVDIYLCVVSGIIQNRSRTIW